MVGLEVDSVHLNLDCDGLGVDRSCDVRRGSAYLLVASGLEETRSVNHAWAGLSPVCPRYVRVRAGRLNGIDLRVVPRIRNSAA